MANVVSEERPPLPLARPKPAPVVSGRRFAAAFLVLAAIVGAAIGLSVILTTGHRHTAKLASSVAWSAWRPAGNGTTATRFIAAHVSAEYRLPSHLQFVAATANSMDSAPIGELVVSSGRAGVPQETINVAYPQAGVLYQLCGRGATCLPAGAGSTEEDPLLYREALELALYTFHYLPKADHVVVFLPPQRGVTTQDLRFHRAVYLSRGDLTNELSEPLANSLLPESSITPAALPVAAAESLTNQITPHVFHWEVEQGPVSLLLYLSPPATG